MSSRRNSWSNWSPGEVFVLNKDQGSECILNTLFNQVFQQGLFFIPGHIDVRLSKSTFKSDA